MKRFAVVLLAVPLMILAGGPSERMKGEDIFQMVSAALSVDDSDGVIADRLRRVEPAEQFPEEAVRVLQELGAGQRTVKALEAISAASKSLPAAPVPAARATPPADVTALLARMTDYVAAHIEQLPNMSCTQTTQFYGRSGKSPWRADDLVVQTVEFVDGEENYRTVRVNGNADSRPVETVRGASSKGEFGSILAHTFDPSSDANFQWDHWESLHGAQVAAFRYAVDQRHSKFRVWSRNVGAITVHGVTRPIERHWISAYRGLVYADPGTGVVVRFTFQNVDPPSGVDFQDGRNVVDYASAVIGGKSYWLPKSVVHYARYGESRTRDEIEFSNYRRFDAESTILFPTEETTPENK